jgi:hypothetical protein
MMQIQTSNARSYNDLMDVQSANRALEERGGEKVVERYLSIIAEAGLQNEVGIRLLHKHNDLHTDEVMLEADILDEEGFALVTAATSESKLVQCACNSWQASPEGYVPIEYSTSKLVDPSFSINEHERVFSHLSEALIRDGMSDLLGPCVLYSNYVADFSPSEDAAFLEKTDVDSRSNVVRYVLRDDVAFTRSSKTKWHAKQMIDASGRLVWMTACNCFCSVAPEGGHQGTTTHQYSE